MLQTIIIIAIFVIFTYIAIKDWQTGLISILLNLIMLALSSIYAFLEYTPLKDSLIKLAIFVLPFIILEVIYQFFFNKERDENKFLVGGGDILLFASIALVLNHFGMLVMLFFASLSSIVVSLSFKKSKIPFAPFLEFGFLIAFLFSNNIAILLINSLQQTQHLMN